jgi:hypothetical protein
MGWSWGRATSSGRRSADGAWHWSPIRSCRARTTSPASRPSARETGARFGLERRKEAPAPGNFGVFPAPFHLVPIVGRRSRSQDLEVRWTPAAGDPMEIELDGNCIELATFEVQQDRGRFTVTAHSLQPRSRADPDSCEVELAVRRVRAGRTDPALSAVSRLSAQQERRVKFFSVP